MAIGLGKIERRCWRSLPEGYADVGAAFAPQRYREPAGYADEQDDRLLANAQN
ncbi:MAG TPA: hypothetical protein V6D25_26325 [Leptolyngbyaceae cyanobacterium]